jgi:pyruvate,water dikinase
MTELDLHTPNPMHHASGPDDAWTTVNTRENYDGVMSPLGATLWMPICDLAVNGCFHDLGVLTADQVVVAPSRSTAPSAVFYGRFAGSITYFRRMADLIPGQSGDAFEEQFFGSSRDGAVDTSSARRYPAIAIKAPVAVARVPRRMRATSRHVEAWWRHVTSGPGADLPAEMQFAQAFANLELAMRTHMVTTFVAQGVFDALGKLAAKAGRPDLHLAASTGYGQMAELELVAALDRVARGESGLEEFLAEYGFRCEGEVEVSNPSWRERPELVEKLLVSYRGAGRRPDLAAQARERSRAREAAERELLAALPASRRSPARALLRLARTYIPLREEGKATLARAFDGVRVACRSRGRELVAAGVLDVEDDVFYLTVDEVRGAPPADARELVARRRELRAAYEQLDLPDHWIGPPTPVAGAPVQAEPVDVLHGVAASHGVVTGRVRVLAGAEECDLLEPDEILVCRTTDPSWAAAFYLTAAVVIDIGSTGSHGAIVAREMGLPCVIGTGNGTAVLRTGDLVRVDGTSGIVTVLTPAEVTA